MWFLVPIIRMPEAAGRMDLPCAEARFIPRVNLVPVPSVWGHVAGGGGDEGAKPFINARIAASLKK